MTVTLKTFGSIQPSNRQALLTRLTAEVVAMQSAYQQQSQADFDQWYFCVAADVENRLAGLGVPWPPGIWSLPTIGPDHRSEQVRKLRAAFYLGCAAVGSWPDIWGFEDGILAAIDNCPTCGAAAQQQGSGVSGALTLIPPKPTPKM